MLDQSLVCVGPGTGLGHNSIIFMIECQVNYAAEAILKLLETGGQSMSVKPEVLRNYVDFVQENMKGKQSDGRLTDDRTGIIWQGKCSLITAR